MADKLRTYKNKDYSGNQKEIRNRDLIVRGTLTDSELHEQMIEVYKELRADVDNSDEPSKEILTYVYSTEADADIGGNMWRGRILESTLSNEWLTGYPAILIKNDRTPYLLRVLNDEEREV